MDEVEPSDRWGAADSSDAVNVDLMVKRGKRLINDFNDLSHQLGLHETIIQYIDVVQRDVSLDEKQWIWTGKIKAEDVSDFELDELRNVSRQYPAALVDLSCYLFGFEGHIGTHDIRVVV